MPLVSLELFPQDLLPGDMILIGSDDTCSVVSLGAIAGTDKGPEIAVQCAGMTLSLPIETPVSVERSE